MSYLQFVELEDVSYQVQVAYDNIWNILGKGMQTNHSTIQIMYAYIQKWIGACIQTHTYAYMCTYISLCVYPLTRIQFSPHTLY